VQIEVDTRRNLVRAVAFGTTELKKDDDNASVGGLEGCFDAASRSMKVDASAVNLAGETAGLYAFAAEIRTKAFFGLFTNARQLVRVVDKTGVVRLQRNNAEVYSSTVEAIARNLETVITKLTDFGDAGRALPDIHVLTERESSIFPVWRNSNKPWFWRKRNSKICRRTKNWSSSPRRARIKFR
jgi:hypothetical protein